MLSDAAADPRLGALWSQLEARWPESRIAPSLDRIGELCRLLGDPQRSYPVIQVAGTNGKTSTARMIESLLRAAGLRTGLYTSPHLVDPRERIRLDGAPIDVDRLLASWAELQPYVELVDQASAQAGGPSLSFFEVVTGLAFASFADAPVDVAVLEAGMGGAWDATNVAHASVAAIMPIGLDHQDYLGETIAQIAAEKAGVIKPGAVAVLAAQVEPAAAVLLERCGAVGASVAREGAEFGLVDRGVAVGGQVLALRGLHARYDDVFLPVFGEHQARNAAVALAVAEAFLAGGGPLDADIVRAGFASVTSPGRLQIVRRNPTVLLDAAHNPHGAAALAQALDDSFEFAGLVGVVGVLAGKDAAGLLSALEPRLTHVVVTQASSARAVPVGDLAAIAAGIFGDDRVTAEPSLADAIDRAVALAEEDAPYGGAGVLVTGSVVLVGDALRLLS